MDRWLQIITLIISTLSLPTLFGLVWKAIADHRKEKSEAVQKAKKEERIKEIRDAVRFEMQSTEDAVKEIKSRLEKVDDGVLSSLRNSILKCYYDCVAKGYRNDLDYENVHHMYESYDSLDGNSFVKDVVNRFDLLPTEEEYHKIKGGACDGPK